MTDEKNIFNPDGEISFSVPGYKGEVLKLAANGDIFVKGKLIENDKEVVEALRYFIIHGIKTGA